MSEKNEWKPIESAPKDGSEIIVFHPQAGVCAAFCPGDGFSWHCMDGMNTGIGKKSGQSIPIMTSFVEPPTHWMPLPAAPGSTSSAPGDAQDGLAEAQRLAEALFQRHFAQDDDYASGRVKWEVLGDLPGVLSQIDNMVSGLVQPAAPAAGDARGATERHTIEGTISFMRSDAESQVCVCCPPKTGHIFSRGVDWDAWETGAPEHFGRGPDVLVRRYATGINANEGKRVRVTVEVLPDDLAAQRKGDA